MKLDFEVYAEGPVFTSVCTSLSPEEAEKRLNEENPTQVEGLVWRLHAEGFRDGTPQGAPCPVSPETHKHYLFSC